MEDTPKPQLPEWAMRERIGDLAWIERNLPIFWPMAQAGYEALGRGALVVDTTICADEGGHPFLYFTHEQIVASGDPDAQRMVTAYDPTWELVAVLLKEHDRLSTYRIGLPSFKPPQGIDP
jgi:hypothetical protein